MEITSFFIVLGVAGIVLVMVYIHDKLFLRKNENENSQLEKMVQEQNRHFEKMMEISKSLEELKTELKERELTLSEKDYYNSYIDKNAETIHSFKQLVVTGDSVLDAVLSQKKIMAEERQVVISFDVRISEKLPLVDVDKVSLFGNILDNAIEAAEKNEAEKFVQFQLLQKESSCIILCRNSKRTDIKLQTDIMETTKEDKENHGRGIRIIKNIVNQYHGVCVLQDEGDAFELKIMI